MPEIRIVISDALAQRKQIAVEKKEPIIIMAVNHLNDEIQQIPADCPKDRFVRIIDLKRKKEEDAFYAFAEADAEELTELPVMKDTILSELAEILRNL